MSVEGVLDKMTAHNAHVLGCIATHDGRVHHNLPDGYGLVDREAVTEYASLMFEASDALETEHEPFDQMFLEYQGHGIYARRLTDGVLILLTDPIQRTQFKKEQIGVNLFLKPLKKALKEGPLDLSEDALIDEVPTRIGDPITPTKRRRWF